MSRWRETRGWEQLCFYKAVSSCDGRQAVNSTTLPRPVSLSNNLIGNITSSISELLATRDTVLIVVAEEDSSRKIESLSNYSKSATKGTILGRRQQDMQRDVSNGVI